MGFPGIQTWTSTLCVFLSWMCAAQAEAGPQYLVAIPAVLESGSTTQFCASLLQPNESLAMTVTLSSPKKNTILLKKTSSTQFHTCVNFQVPVGEEDVVQRFEVKVEGKTFKSEEVRKVMVKAYQPRPFVQTDKPMYLPGQTVHFRVVSLDSKLRPFSQMYNIIEVEDTNGNRIGQWLNQTSSGNILQLSYPLNSEAREGAYGVFVTVGGIRYHHSFKVEKYVLPKFEVTVSAPDEISISQAEVTVEVCAKYTFGQPVPGSVSAEVCRPLSQSFERPEPGTVLNEITGPCHKEAKQADKKGCATFHINTSTFQKLDKKILQDSLTVRAAVQEEGTGVSHDQQQWIYISYVIGRLSFFDTPEIYKEGSNVAGKVRAVHYDGTPIPAMPVFLFEGEFWSSRLLRNLTTDSQGVASFSISSADLKGENFLLHVSDKPVLTHLPFRSEFYEPGDHRLSLAQVPSAHTKTSSFLVVKRKEEALSCDKEETISIQYTVVGEGQGSMDVMYLVLARGAIVKQGSEQVVVPDKSVTEGEVSFTLRVTPAMAPDVQVVAYALLPSQNVVANAADFSTEKCFINKVSLEFSPSSAVPQEQVVLKVKAQPHSLCGVSAVDRSVLIKEPGQTLEAEWIFNLLPVNKLNHIPFELEDFTECLLVRPRRSSFPFPTNGNEDDAHTVFKNVGLKMATNLHIQLPSCLKYKGKEYHQGRFGIMFRNAPMAMPLEAVNAPPGPIQTIRTFFPETWIWDLVEVGVSGHEDVSVTVPDTITTWETEAFCLSPLGFGLAPRQQIKVFQPFFLGLSLPYSVIRGEYFELKATVFNYLSSCIMVTVTPAPSPDYILTPIPGEKYTSCLCDSERRTLRWTLAPSALGVMDVSVTAEAVASHTSCGNQIVSVPEKGRVDVVTRTLIVKAEGTEMTKTYNWLLCPTGTDLTESFSIQLPKDKINGSARATLSVLGDILGRAMHNLDGLLKMPYGCGEQNMALLAPNIYILEYLQYTQQLTPAIKEKATNFLKSGYQRQLNYKHPSHGYSTFGTGTENTWLTAFVQRSFARAQAFIFIDPAVIGGSMAWLESKQKQNGCFQQSGKLFNNRMKGGVSDEVTLSAYITAAFLEMNYSSTDPVVAKSLSCLKESVSGLSNTYTAALLAYVFTLAGDTDTRAQLLNHLDMVAIKQGGLLHWDQTRTDTSASLSVEISSYVLLAKLSASPTTEEQGYATKIVRWLTRQQNYNGGFSSTQDTVVALQALALYSTVTFSRGKSKSLVTVQSPWESVVFAVNPDNKLLYQEKELKGVEGLHKLTVKGSACALVQISVDYNVPTSTAVNTVSVGVETRADCKSNLLTLTLTSQYSGEQLITNMVILDIKMLSGFVPEPQSLDKLKHALLVDMVEQKGDHVLVYIDGLLQNQPITHTLDLIQEVPVVYLKPAVVKIYDYYQTSDQSETEYNFLC